MSKEDVLKVIGNRFFVWFLTLALLIMGMTLILNSDNTGLLSERIIGAVVISPVSIPLITVFKNKTEKQVQEFKIKIKQIRNDRLKLKQDYKLERLRIKHQVK